MKFTIVYGDYPKNVESASSTIDTKSIEVDYSTEIIDEVEVKKLKLTLNDGVNVVDMEFDKSDGIDLIDVLRVMTSQLV